MSMEELFWDINRGAGRTGRGRQLETKQTPPLVCLFKHSGCYGMLKTFTLGNVIFCYRVVSIDNDCLFADKNLRRSHVSPSAYSL